MKALRLRLGQRYCRVYRGNLPSTTPRVVPQSINIDAIGSRVGVDLKTSGLAAVNTYIGGETLNAGVAGPGNFPLTRKATRQRVFTGNRIAAGKLRVDLSGTPSKHRNREEDS